jgi:hypothetical protein
MWGVVATNKFKGGFAYNARFFTAWLGPALDANFCL